MSIARSSRIDYTQFADKWHEAPVNYPAMTNRFNDPGYHGRFNFVCAPQERQPLDQPVFTEPANYWGETYGRPPNDGGSEYRALDLYGHNTSLLKIPPTLVLQDPPVAFQMH